jgi:aryl-alcohol dehydrogenase-like predicted oxidoreductase
MTLKSNKQPKRIPLGQSDVMIPPMGVGVWAWGDRFFWDYGQDYDRDDIRQAFDAAIDHGLTFFDTAETYGFGQSERLLGMFAETTESPLQIATKFFPYPWRLAAGQLLRAARGSLGRLGLDRIDLYQIHWPLPPRDVRTWVRQMAEAHEAGLIEAIGVSNFNVDQMLAAIEVLAEADLPLASNQVRYSLLDRGIERSGLKQACSDHGVTLIAYSPLGQGLLTGKYSLGHPMPRARGRRVNAQTMRRLPSLLECMSDIAENHGGKSLPQVALNWVIAKGAVPIPGAKNAHQAADNAGALGWALSGDELNMLDASSQAGRAA